jgi:hypothetical protein
MTDQTNRQPWIYSSWVDGLFILSPSLLATAIVISAPRVFASNREFPLWGYVVLVLAIDVGHVYSTLFRTYFDPDEFGKQSTLFTLVPLLGWMGGVLLYTMGSLMFWRALAYLAVFHFIRQQYGFMMIYSRRDTGRSGNFRWIDKIAIYMATLYPLIYWHTHMPRNFYWFVRGDFGQIPFRWLDRLALSTYVCCLVVYAIKEVAFSVRAGRINLPKNILLLGTMASWYVGIVCFNGDLAFTVTNVVSHGIPYMALIWIYGHNKSLAKPRRRSWPFPKGKWLFATAGIPLFVASIFLFAYIEEGLWDGFVWRDHAWLFRWFASLPQLTDQATLAWLVPLLALPQITHYLLDGFIWRIRGGNAEWKQFVFRHQT